MSFKSESPSFVITATSYLSNVKTNIQLCEKLSNESPSESPLSPLNLIQGDSSKSHVSIDLCNMSPLESPYIYIKSIEIGNRAYRDSYLHPYKVLKHRGTQGLRDSTSHTRRLR